MTTYRIKAPNGQTYQIEGPEGASQDEVIAAVLAQDPSAGELPDPSKQGFIPAASATFDTMQGQAALLAGKLGLISKEEAVAEQQRQEEEAKATFQPTTDGWSESPWLKFKETLGGSLPYSVAPLAAGAAAVGLGAPGLVAAGLGTLASAGQFTMSNLARQVEAGKSLEEASLGKAAAYAVPQALLDTVAGRMIPGVGKLLGAAGVKVTAETAKDIAAQTLAKTAADYLAATGKSMTAEGLTEVGQQFLERLQAGLAIDDPEARKEYLDSLIGGAVVGGALSVPGRYMERRSIAAGPQPAADEQPLPPQTQRTPEQIEQMRALREAIQTRKAVGPLYAEGEEPVREPAPATVAPEPVEGEEPVQEPVKRVEPATSMRAPFADELATAGLYADALKFASSKAGRKWLTPLVGMDPAEARAQRDNFVPKKSSSSVKADIFDTLFPEPAAAPVEPAAAPVEPAAAPVEPAAAPVEPAAAPVEPAAAPVSEQDLKARWLAAQQDFQQKSDKYQKAVAAAGNKRKGSEVAAKQEASRLKSAASEALGQLTVTAREQGFDPTAWATASVEPASVEPASVEPASVEPASVEPASVEPAPVEPASVEPAPVEPAPVEPASVEPAYATAADWWADQMEGAESDIGAFASLRPENQATLEAWFEEGALTGADADRVLAAERAGQDFNPAKFRRTERTTGGMRKDEAQAVADAVRARWANAPEVKVVESMDDPEVPQSVRDEDARQRAGGAKGEPQAFWDKGTAYLVSGQVSNATEAMTAMFHEILGHYGLRGTFGKALDAILKQIANARRADVDAVAKKYGLDTGKESDRMVAAEEVLANLAQTQPELGFVKRAVAAIRSWLRQNVPGFQNLKLTDAEIINDFILPARRFVESGQRAKAPVAGKVAMSRKAAKAAPAAKQDQKALAQEALERRTKAKMYVPDTPTSLAKKSVNKVKKTITGREDGIGLIDIVRTYAADNKAVLATQLNDMWYDNMPTDVLGETSSLVKARQADDVGKFMEAMFAEGTLEIDDTGRLAVKKLDVAPNDMYQHFVAYAKDKGMSFEEAYARLDVIFEALRVNELIKSNVAGDTDVSIHLRKPDGSIDFDAIRGAVDEYNDNKELLDKIYEAMDKPRIALLDALYKSGRLTAEDAKALREVQYYVPFDRVGLDEQARAFRSVKGNKASGYGTLMKIPQLKGSFKLQVGNVFENYYRTMAWLATELAKQNAGSSLATDMEALGIAEPITEAQSKYTPHYIKVYEKGELQYYSVPSKYHAIPFADPKKTWSITAPLAAVANLKRISITANPVFATKQVFMDTQAALILTDVHSPLKFVSRVFGNFGKVASIEVYNAVRAMFNKPPITPELERKMSELGMSGEIDYINNNPALEAMISAGLRQRKLFGSTKLGAIVHALQQISHGADLAVREALYADEVAHSKDEIQAVTKARELINFRRRGSSEVLNNLVPMVPFLNAYIQGTDVVFRAVRGKDNIMGRPAKEAQTRLAAAVCMYAGVAFVYAMSKKDDDEDDTVYRELTKYVRNNNWIFPNGVKIPVRQDIAVIKVAVENAVEWFTRQGKPDELAGKQAVKNAMVAIWDAYGAALPIPAALQPLFEIMTNYSAFTGRQLVGTYPSKLDPSQQITPATSEAAKSVAKWVRDTTTIEVSPVHIDHAIRGYFGTAGAAVSQILDKMLNPDRLDRPIHQQLVIGAFTWDSDLRTNPKDEFYEFATEINKRKATFNRLAETDLAEAQKYLKEHPAEIAAYTYVNATLDKLGNVRKVLTYIQSPNGVEQYPDRAERERLKADLEKTEYELTKGIREAQRIFKTIKPEDVTQ